MRQLIAGLPPSCHLEYWKTRLLQGTQEEAVNRVLGETPLFFILSTGRCATLLLAELLGKSPGAQVLHEPCWLDWAALSRAYRSPQQARDYIRTYRRKRIYTAIKRNSCTVYGETSPPLLYHAPALKELLPRCQLIHLVRDGREVVRSWMNRGTYAHKRVPIYRRLEPLPGDPWHETWPQMDQFSRCCWLWTTNNRRLADTCILRAEFKCILTDYGAFEGQILEPLGLDVSERDWREAVDQPRNRSKSLTFPHPEDWSQTQHDQFQTICGDMMRALGLV